MRVERRADGGEGCSGSAGGVVVTAVCSSAGGCSGHRTGRAGMRLSRVPRGAKNGWGGGGFCKSERECCKGGLTIWRQDEEEDEENGRASLRLFPLPRSHDGAREEGRAGQHHHRRADTRVWAVWGVWGVWPHASRRLLAHKYSCEGSTILDPYFQVWWQKAVTFLPMWLAPNLVTLTGLVMIIVSSTTAVLYCPDIGHEQVQSEVCYFLLCFHALMQGGRCRRGCICSQQSRCLPTRPWTR